MTRNILLLLVLVVLQLLQGVEMIAPNSRVVVLAACATPGSGNTSWIPVVTADGNHWDVYGQPFLTEDPFGALGTLGPVSAVGNGTLFYMTQGTGPMLGVEVHIFPSVIGYELANTDKMKNVTFNREEKNDYLLTYCIQYHPSGVLMALTESGYGLINYETGTLTLLNKIAQGNQFGYGAKMCSFDGTKFWTQAIDGLDEYKKQCGGNQACMLGIDPLTGKITDVIPSHKSQNSYISTVPLPNEKETTFSAVYFPFGQDKVTAYETTSGTRTKVADFEGIEVEFSTIDVTDGPLGQMYYLSDYQSSFPTFVQLDMESGKRVFQTSIPLPDIIPQSFCEQVEEAEVFDIIVIPAV